MKSNKRIFLFIFSVVAFSAVAKATTVPLSLVYSPTVPGKPYPLFSIFFPSDYRVPDSSYQEPTKVFAAIWSDGTIIKRNSKIDYPAPGFNVGTISTEVRENFLSELLTLEDSYQKVNSLDNNHYYFSVLSKKNVGTWSFGQTAVNSENNILMLFDKYMSKSDRITTGNFHFTDAVIRTSLTENEEIKAAWITRADLLLPPTQLQQMLLDIKECGVTTLYLNIQSRGFKLYPDQTDRLRGLLMDPEVERHNQAIIPWITAEAKKMGFKVMAWGEYGMYGQWSKTENPADTSDWIRRNELAVGRKYSGDGILFNNQNLVALDSEGKDFFYSEGYGYYRVYCPSNPKSHEELMWLYKEALTSYSFDGLILIESVIPMIIFAIVLIVKSTLKLIRELNLSNSKKVVKIMVYGTAGGQTV